MTLHETILPKSVASFAGLTSTRNSTGAKARASAGIIAGLDIGESKFACLIARTAPNGPVVLGAGNRASGGVVNGLIEDQGKAELAIRSVVDQAERMAGQQVDGVYVSFTGGGQRTALLTREMDLGGHALTQQDVARLEADLHQEAKHGLERSGRAIIYCRPAAFLIDDASFSAPPIGKKGCVFTLSLLTVSVEAGHLQRLLNTVERAQLAVDGFVPGPVASSLGALSGDARQNGAACIDLGAQHVTIGFAIQRLFVQTISLPIGGADVNRAIMAALSVDFEEANRLRSLHGCLLKAPSDKARMLEVRGKDRSGAATHRFIKCSELTRATCAGFAPLVKAVADAFYDAGITPGSHGCHVALVGGLAETQGLAEHLSQTLGLPVHKSRPQGVKAMPSAVATPAFAATVGLLEYAQHYGQTTTWLPQHRSISTHLQMSGGNGRWSERMMRWIRHSF